MNSEIIRNFKYKKVSPNQIHVHESHWFICKNCDETIITRRLKKSAEIISDKNIIEQIENILSLHLMQCDKYHYNNNPTTIKKYAV